MLKLAPDDYSTAGGSYSGRWQSNMQRVWRPIWRRLLIVIWTMLPSALNKTASFLPRRESPSTSPADQLDA